MNDSAGNFGLTGTSGSRINVKSRKPFKWILLQIPGMMAKKRKLKTHKRRIQKISRIKNR